MPAAGEGLTSYVEQLSDLLGTPLATVISATGLVSAAGVPVVHGWGMAMSSAQLTDFAQATRLAPEMVKSMLLTSYDGTFLDLSDVDPTVPMSVRRAAVREWARVNGTRFCPDCLGCKPAVWQLRWKLNWSFACVKHRVLLCDDCQQCGRPAGLGRGDMTSTPAYLGKLAQPGCCRNVPTKGNGGRGAKSMPCGAEMWLQAASSLPDGGRALRAQGEIDKRIECATDPSITLTEAGRIRDFARETRALSALILLAGDSRHFCQEAEPMQAAVQAHLGARGRLAALRSQMGRSAPRQRVFTRSGMNSALTAAALTPAVEIASVERVEELVEALIPLARSLQGSTRITNRQLVKDFQFTERLTDAYRTAVVATTSFGRISKAYACDQGRTASKQFGPQHVPQLAPESVYETRFRHMLPGVQSLAGRRFVSLAAVKSFGGTWVDAATELDLPEPAASYSKKAMPLINRQGHGRLFLNEIAAWVDALRRQNEPIDYQQRRRLLASLRDLPRAMWSSACKQAGIRRGERGRRSRYVAAWLWADLTQGDWRLSPAMKAMADEPNAREIYVKLIEQVADVLPVVRQSGQELLRMKQYDSARKPPSAGSVFIDGV